MEATGTLSLTDGEGTLADDVLEPRKIYVSGAKLGIGYIPPERYEYVQNNIVGTTPLYYTILGSTIKLLPRLTTTLDLDYYKRFPSISDTNTSGPLLTAHGILYLEAALFEAFAFMQERDTAIDHLARARSLIAGANRLVTRFPGKLTSRPRTTIP